MVSVRKLDGHLHLPSNSRLIADGATAGSPAVFLDRDGVLIKDVDHLQDPSQIRVLSGVAESLRALEMNFSLIVVTNQSVVSRGMLTERGLLDIHTELVQQLYQEDARLDAIYYCPHLPDGMLPAHNKLCDCRKPRPGMLLLAAKRWGIDMARSYIVGDRNSDMQAGQAASVKGIIVESEFAVSSDYDRPAADLAHATQIILNENDI